MGALLTALEFVVLALALLVLGSIVWSTLRLGISPMPTSARVRRALLDQIPRELTGTIFELGSGWGGLALALSAHCPQARVVAIEASPFPFWVTRMRARLARRSNLEVQRGDFLTVDLRLARLVITYLWTGAMTQLTPKLEAELPEGAELITHTFGLRGRTPTEVTQLTDLYRTPIYRYRFPTTPSPH